MTVTFGVEIDFPGGKREIEMVQKKGHEIEECEEGKVIILILKDGQQLTGIFKGIADEDVKIGTLDEKHCLGYKLRWVDKYFEEVKSEA